MSWTPISPWRLGKAQTVAIGASAANNSTAFGSSTQAVMVTPTSNCHVRFGQPNPAAVSTDTFLSAGVPYVFAIGIGDFISVIQDSASGTLYVTELSH